MQYWKVIFTFLILLTALKTYSQPTLDRILLRDNKIKQIKIFDDKGALQEINFINDSGFCYKSVSFSSQSDLPDTSSIILSYYSINNKLIKTKVITSFDSLWTINRHEINKHTTKEIYSSGEKLHFVIVHKQITKGETSYDKYRKYIDGKLKQVDVYKRTKNGSTTYHWSRMLNEKPRISYSGAKYTWDNENIIKVEFLSESKDMTDKILYFYDEKKFCTKSCTIKSYENIEYSRKCVSYEYISH